ncbi:MAG: redoxin domain-containing protein [Chloroflexi bacterium]|nr:redoxin domain-containing protein [Chloroflexota bacterium]
MANSDFEEKDTQVLGISTDARPTQTAFAASLGNIPYPVLADFHPKGQVSKLYGVYNEERGTANRAVVIVDKQGIVRFSRVYTSMPELDTADVLAEIGKL